MNTLILIPESDYRELHEKLDSLLEAKGRSMKEEDTWLSNDEAMAFLKVSKSTLQTYRNKGIIPYCQVGRKLRYNRQDLIKFLESNKSTVYAKGK